MGQLARRQEYTFAEYVALEEASNVKHEYCEGEIYAMAGGTPQHAQLCAALILALGNQLSGGPCKVYSSDLRVRVLESGLATYPDVTVVRGELQYDPEDATTIVNPTLVAEVLSDSTQSYDRGEKFSHFQKIPSLALCLFVSHRQPLIEIHQRKKTRWTKTTVAAGETASLEGPPCALAVDQVYRGVTL